MPSGVVYYLASGEKYTRHTENVTPEESYRQLLLQMQSPYSDIVKVGLNVYKLVKDKKKSKVKVKKISPILKEALGTLKSYKKQLEEAKKSQRSFDTKAGIERVESQTAYIKRYWPNALDTFAAL